MSYEFQGVLWFAMDFLHLYSLKSRSFFNQIDDTKYVALGKQKQQFRV